MTDLIDRLKEVQLRGNTAPENLDLLEEARQEIERLRAERAAAPQDDEATLRRIVKVLHPEWNEHRQPVGFDEARRVLAAISAPQDDELTVPEPPPPADTGGPER